MLVVILPSNVHEPGMRTIGASISAAIEALGSASIPSFAVIWPLAFPAISAEPQERMLNETTADFAMPTWEGVCKEPSNLPSIRILDEDVRFPVALMFLLSTVEKRSGFLDFPLFIMNSPDQYGITTKKPSECNVLKAFVLPVPGVEVSVT